MQVHRAEAGQRQDAAGQELPVGDDRPGRRASASRTIVDTPRVTDGLDLDQAAAPAVGPRPRRPWAAAANRGRPVAAGSSPRSTGAARRSAAHRGLERTHRPRVVAKEHGSEFAHAARIVVGVDQASSRRRIRRFFGSSSAEFEPAQLGHDVPPPLVVQMIDVEHAVQVIGLVLEDPGEQPFGRHLVRSSPSTSWPRHVMTADRGVGWNGPGIDRQPSSSKVSPRRRRARGWP